MAIIIGKLQEALFISQDGSFTVYRVRISGGKRTTAIYRGTDAPKPLKTVQFVLFGEWVTHPTYGKQFEIGRVERYNPLTQYDIGEAQVCRETSKALGEVTTTNELARYEPRQPPPLTTDENPLVNYRMTLTAAHFVLRIRQNLIQALDYLASGRAHEGRHELERMLQDEGVTELDQAVMSLAEL